jgi:hypothetical protein
VFKKLFGQKNDGFYMQIDDAPTAKVAANAKPAATKVAAPTAVTATPTAAVAAPAAATPLTPAEKKVADAEKAVAKTAAKAEKKSAKKAVDEKKVAAVAPAPALPPITNFATDYLIKPSSDSTRRRPGANMSKFLELAREAKIPVNVKK